MLIVIKALQAALLATAAAAGVIAALAPAAQGVGATLAAWQVFLALVFGFAGALAAALLVAERRAAVHHQEHDRALALARDERAMAWNEWHQRRAREREASRRGVDRVVVAAAMMAEIQSLTRFMVDAAMAAAEPAGDTATVAPPDAAPAFRLDHSDRLALLGGKAINHVVRFHARFCYWETARRAAPAGGGEAAGRIAQGCAEVAGIGVDCLRRVATAAKLADDAVEPHLLASGFHRLPDALIAGIEEHAPRYRTLANHLRARHNAQCPESPLPLLPD